MYPQAQLDAVAVQEKRTPLSPKIIVEFEANLASMSSSIYEIEERCHRLLNLRTPEKSEKEPTPMENDLFQQLNNRLNAFSQLNDRLNAIVRHLDNIV
jgi:hypothetical protein